MKLMTAISLLFFTVASHSSEAPQSFTYQGKLFKANATDPVEASSVVLKIQLRSPDGLCLLFEETHLRDMTGSGGIFSLVVGEGTNTGASTLSLKQVFDNSSAKTGANGCSYVPTTNDARRLRFTYNDGVQTVSLPTDQSIRSVPYAIYANSLQGLGKDSFIQVSGQTTQARVNGLLNVADDVIALAQGNSNLYAKATDLPFAGGVLNLSTTGVRVADTPASADQAVNKNYTDSRIGGRSLDLTGLTSGQTLAWDSSLNKWKGVSPQQGTLTSIVAGAGLSGGTITSSGMISLTPVGTAGNYAKVTTDSYGRVVSGANLVEADLPTIQAPGKVSGSAIVSGTIGGATVISTSANIATSALISAPNIVSTTSSLQALRVFNSTSTNKVTLSVPSAIANDYSLVLPTTSGASGQVLATDGSGNLSWTSVSSTAQPTGAAGGDLQGSYPNPSVAKIQNVAVSASLPVASQVLRFNGANYAPSFTNFLDLKNSVGFSQIPTNCSASQTLTYSAVVDAFLCTTVTVSVANVSGLGSVATKNAPGSGDAAAAEVVLGSDTRLTNSRAPSGSAAGDLTGSYPNPQLTATGVTPGTYTKLTVDSKGRVDSAALLQASDIPNLSWSKLTSGVPTTLTGYGISDALSTSGGVSSIAVGLDLAKPAAGSSGRLFVATDTNRIYYDTGSAWQTVASAVGSSIVSGVIGGSTSISTSGSIATTSSVTAATMTSTSSSLQSLRVFNAANTNKVTLSSPSALAADYSLVLPLTVGTSGQHLATDGSGNLSWVTPSTTATPTGSAGGDLSGTYPNPVVSKLQGVGVASTTPTSGQTLRYNGTNYSPSYINVSDVKNTLGLSQFPTNCTSSQTLTYNVVTDSYLCTTLSVPVASVTGLGSAASRNVASTGDAASSEVVTGSDTRLSDSRAPSGAAGGDLSGSYPNPSLQATGVSAGTYSKVTVDLKGRVVAGTSLSSSDIPSLSWSKISSGVPTTLAGFGITDALSTAGGVTSFAMGLDAAKTSTGTANRIYFATDTSRIYRDTGSAWQILSSAQGTGGTVTSVSPGTGLTGSAITSSGTMNVDVGTSANKIVQLDGNAKLPAVDGSQLTNLSLPALTNANMQVFDASGTWTPPAGVTKVYVQAWGAGGGGGGGSILLTGGGTGGSGGAYAAGIYTLSGTGAVTITVGAAGVKGTAANAGANGGTSSFGSYITAAGGSGGTSGGTTPMSGGVASGVLGVTGGQGLPAMGSIGGQGGVSFGGSSTAGSYASTAAGSAATSPGCGGGGGYGTAVAASAGGNGAIGRVVVWW